MAVICYPKKFSWMNLSDLFSPKTFFFCSSQKTSTRSRNSCHYSWCSAGAGLPSFPQHDPQVQDFLEYLIDFYFLCRWHSWALKNNIWFPIFLSQGCEGRKRSADWTRAGQIGRLWLRLHRLTCKLLCRNSLLVSEKGKLVVTCGLNVPLSKNNEFKRCLSWLLVESMIHEMDLPLKAFASICVTWQ